LLIFTGGAASDSYQARVATAVLSEAFRRNGFRFRAEYHPSLRSLTLSNSGELDGELHRVANFHELSGRKYSNLIRIESKLLSLYTAVFSKQELRINAWGDLKGYRVAYYRGRKNIEHHLKGLLGGNRILALNDDEQAFAMLALGRADVVITTSNQGRQIVAGRPDLSGVREVGRVDEDVIYAYINTKHRALALKIAKTMEAMKLDGSFEAIVTEARGP
jgi:ABC-type amino acid transport substrate-binding protein